ncbi:MAG: hypothetical protein H0X53_02820 [Sphingomonas sp.]|nr:hypothetical protein [Sphingomonas sp.]
MAATTNGEPRSIPWRMVGWGTAGFLLLLPLVTGAPWTVSDYILVAVIFGTVGGLIELTVRKTASFAYRAGVAIALAASVFHIWFTGAVGIIGNESNPGNVLYLGVVALAIFGSIASLGRARTLARVMVIVAIAEMLVPPIAYAGLADPVDAVLRTEVFVLGTVFTGMWLLSAWLFREAAHKCDTGKAT